MELDFSPDEGELNEGFETYDGFGLVDPYEYE